MVSAPLVVEPFGPGSSLARGADAGAAAGEGVGAGSGFFTAAGDEAGFGDGFTTGLATALTAGLAGVLVAGLALLADFSGAFGAGLLTTGLALPAGLAGVGEFFTLAAIFFAAPLLGVGLFAISRFVTISRRLTKNDRKCRVLSFSNRPMGRQEFVK